MNKEKVFETCPYCLCHQFYTQKDFNRLLGCVVVMVGIILVPKTYGLSLPVVALMDWFLYRKVPTMVICYRCGTEYRGFSVPTRFKSFIHAIGEKYERETNNAPRP